MPKLNDLTGQTFGRLTVVCRADDIIQPNGRRRVRWRCHCVCGNEIDALPDNLMSGKTMSCGCLRNERNKDKFSTHHQTDTKLYGVWCSMRSRCNNRNSSSYKNYGGRGIAVCEEWDKSFESFRDWSLASGYHETAGSHECTLDRIDVNGNYEPGNCRWVDSVAQANNRRTNRMYTYHGETHNLTEWAAIMGINPKTLFNRIYTGWDFETAIKTKITNKSNQR